jgi:hypothetical protein
MKRPPCSRSWLPPIASFPVPPFAFRVCSAFVMHIAVLCIYSTHQCVEHIHGSLVCIAVTLLPSHRIVPALAFCVQGNAVQARGRCISSYILRCFTVAYMKRPPSSRSWLPPIASFPVPPFAFRVCSGFVMHIAVLCIYSTHQCVEHIHGSLVCIAVTLLPSHRIVPGPSICVQGLLSFCDAHCGSVHILHTPVCGAYPRFPCVYRSNAASLPSHRSRSLHLRSGKCRVRGRCIKSYILRCFTVAYTACCPALSQPAASSPSHRSQPSHFAFREMPCKQEGGPSRHISYGVSP